MAETVLRDVSDAKEEVLRQWDERLAAVCAQYHTHPQRLRRIPTSMEECQIRKSA